MPDLPNAQSSLAFAGTAVLTAPSSITLAAARSAVGVRASAVLSGPVTLPAARCIAVFSGSAALRTAGAGYSVKDAYAQILALWGKGCGDSCACDGAGKAALDIINECVQTVYLRAKDLAYLSAKNITALVSSTPLGGGLDGNCEVYELPENVQCLLGPVELLTWPRPSSSVCVLTFGDGQHEITTSQGITYVVPDQGTALFNKSAMEALLGADTVHFTPYYYTISLGSSPSLTIVSKTFGSGGVVNSTAGFVFEETTYGTANPIVYPIQGVATRSEIQNFYALYQEAGKKNFRAYYLDAVATTDAERTSLRILVPKDPLDYSEENAYAVRVDVAVEPPRYTEVSLTDGTAFTIPHRYVESLLLPLIRWKASLNQNMVRRDTAALYKEEAQYALASLGLADPANPKVEKPEGGNAA